MSYETVIGLEVHLQLATATKAFCGCSRTFGNAPNSQTCPVCLGFPGSLPVLNEKAFRYAIRVALALRCEIQRIVKFDRKNYYYPDLPKNFQISQYDMPLSYNGYVDIPVDGRQKRIRVKRVHLEEDAGKLLHETGGDYSLVDLNRAGEPLLEIVTEPDLSSPQEAYDYLTALKSILKYLKVSDCDMEKGSLRCDANVSIRETGELDLGTKVEVKNMNSFKNVRQALEYEVKRQVEMTTDGGRIYQETRLWDANKLITTSMRRKEEAMDYRYFPEPDLVPFEVAQSVIDEIRRELPELPEARRSRFEREFGLTGYDAAVITADRDVADFYETAAAAYKNHKTLANWIMGDIASQMNERALGIAQLGLSPRALAEMLALIDSGALSGKMAKEVLLETIETKKTPAEIVAAKGLSQISDKGELERVVAAVIAKNSKSVCDYKGGTKNALSFLVGQVMKETRGKANPAVVNELLLKELGG